MPEFLDPHTIATIEERRLAEVLGDVSTQTATFGPLTCGFGVPGSWLNQAAGWLPDRALTEDDIRAVETFYEERGCVPKLLLAPHLHEGVAPQLADRSWVFDRVDLTFAIDLATSDDPECRLPDDLRIEEVDLSASVEVDAWSRAFGRLFWDNACPEDEVAITTRCVTHERNTAFRVMHEEELVGVGSVEIFENLACLWGGAVNPEQRRRGVQRALISVRMQHAKEMGMRYATVGAPPGGGTERNALRAGMQLMYPRIELIKPGEGLLKST